MDPIEEPIEVVIFSDNAVQTVCFVTEESNEALAAFQDSQCSLQI